MPDVNTLTTSRLATTVVESYHRSSQLAFDFLLAPPAGRPQPNLPWSRTHRRFSAGRFEAGRRALFRQPAHTVPGGRITYRDYAAHATGYDLMAQRSTNNHAVASCVARASDRTTSYL